MPFNSPVFDNVSLPAAVNETAAGKIFCEDWVGCGRGVFVCSEFSHGFGF